MPAFIITAKSDRCGRKIKKGQTFQIVTNYENICTAAIADGLEALLGKWAREASHIDYWIVRKM